MDRIPGTDRAGALGTAVLARYWYFRPLEFSCRHCAEGGGVRVVEPETVACRHRIGCRTEHLREG